MSNQVPLPTSIGQQLWVSIITDDIIVIAVIIVDRDLDFIHIAATFTIIMIIMIIIIIIIMIIKIIATVITVTITILHVLPSALKLNQM